MKTYYLCLFICISLIPSLAFAEFIEVSVHGLECELCAQDVVKSLQQIPGTKNVKADIVGQQIKIESAKGITLSQPTISQTVVNSGYQVMSIKIVDKDTAKEN